MIKFRLKEDWYIDDLFERVKVYGAGHIFYPSEEEETKGKYVIENPIHGGRMLMTFDMMLNAKDGDRVLLEPIDEQEIEMLVEEVPEDKDNEVKNWRIQLDVKTSLKNLKKIEVFIKENIKEML